MISLMWVDREWCFYIGNIKRTEQTEPIYWKCWQQIDETIKEDAELVHLKIPQPLMIKLLQCLWQDGSTQSKEAN